MVFTYRFSRRGVIKEHHAETLEELVQRAFTDIEQDRADPIEIREGRRVRLDVTEISDMWVDYVFETKIPKDWQKKRQGQGKT